MIQWYPGHMAKAIREMKEIVKLCDLVIILLDARVPESSLNPEFKSIFNNKKVLYVLTKTDKADEKMTNYFIKNFSTNGNLGIAVDARNRQAKKMVEKSALEIMKDKIEKDKQKGLKFRPIRTMIVGIPNVGKSTLINTLSGKKVASVGDKPGVTKSQQWVRISDVMELLDTPGVLWPKFENQEVGYNLAISGAIKDDILPLYDVGKYFIDFMFKYYKGALYSRYEISEENTSEDYIELVGKKLNYLKDDKEVDQNKVCKYLLQEFRNGYFGKITLDQSI